MRVAQVGGGGTGQKGDYPNCTRPCRCCRHHRMKLNRTANNNMVPGIGIASMVYGMALVSMRPNTVMSSNRTSLQVEKSSGERPYPHRSRPSQSWVRNCLRSRYSTSGYSVLMLVLPLLYCRYWTRGGASWC